MNPPLVVFFRIHEPLYGELTISVIYPEWVVEGRVCANAHPPMWNFWQIPRSGCSSPLNYSSWVKSSQSQNNSQSITCCQKLSQHFCSFKWVQTQMSCIAEVESTIIVDQPQTSSIKRQKQKEIKKVSHDCDGKQKLDTIVLYTRCHQPELRPKVSVLN